MFSSIDLVGSDTLHEEIVHNKKKTVILKKAAIFSPEGHFVESQILNYSYWCGAVPNGFYSEI